MTRHVHNLGRETHRLTPPVASRVVTTDGGTIYTRAHIERGRQV
jgi:nitric oxide reductase large subunit